MDSNNVWNLIAGDPAALAAYDALSKAGGTVYVVGGALRDLTLGNKPKDIDLMVRGLDGDAIETALKPVGIVNYTGISFGVYRLRVGNSEVEIAMPRSEVSTGPMHTDFNVQSDPNLSTEEDLRRRDFTGNAMAYDISANNLIDPYGGQKDLQEGNLKLVNPDAFKEDPLRIVRALVAYSRDGLQPDASLIGSMKEHAAAIKNLPGERIQEELTKLLSGKNPAGALRIAQNTGLMSYLVPELDEAFGFDQHNIHHDLDVGSHTLMVLQAMTEISNDPDMRLAVLLHDTGKPEAFWQDEEGHGHFYELQHEDGTTVGKQHEDVSAELTTSFLRRLGYSNERINRVVNLVQDHMWNYFDTPRGARKFLASLNGNTQMAWDLIRLREADSRGRADGTRNKYDEYAIAKSKEMLEKVLEEENAFTTKDLKIDGHDLMALGLVGPAIGAMQKFLLSQVIDDPQLNNREDLLRIVNESSS